MNAFSRMAPRENAVFIKIYIDIYSLFCYSNRKEVFFMPNIRPISELRNNANRVSNCELANIEKTVKAA